MTSKRALAIASGVAILGFVIDGVSKYLVMKDLDGHPSVEIVGSWVKFTYVRNPGAAFGLGVSFTPVITVVALIAGVLTIRYLAKTRNGLWALALGLLLAGILGNLSDRLFRDPGPFRGHVVDFIQLPHYAVFNVADMCINVAAVLIVIQLLRGVRLDGSRAGVAEHGASGRSSATEGDASRPPRETDPQE